MGLIGIYGKGGSGKNVITMYFLKKWFDNLPKFLNFDTKLPNAEKIDSVRLFELDFSDPNQLIIVVWDEAYTEIEDRNFMDVGNRINSYLMMQARKNNMSIVSIAQLDMLDIRWEKLEGYIIACQDRPILNSQLEHYKGDFHYFISNKRKVSPFTLKYKTAKKLFPLYDTRQKILPKDFERMKRTVIMRNPKERNKEINRLVEEIKAKVQLPETIKEITHNWLRDVMLMLEMDLAFEKYVYVRLHRKTIQKPVIV